jgi:hypothetical protein
VEAHSGIIERYSLALYIAAEHARILMLRIWRSADFGVTLIGAIPMVAGYGKVRSEVKDTDTAHSATGLWVLIK